MSRVGGSAAALQTELCFQITGRDELRWSWSREYLVCVLSSAQRPVSPSAPRGVSDFSHCYGQTANEKQLKGARADLGLRSEVT